MSFIVFDIGLLICFAIFISIFLYIRRKNLKKEGLLLLYKTSWGIKLINCIGKKYQRTLKFLSYVAITLGYFLMAAMVYLLGKIAWIYIFNQDIVRAIKVPPIMPLIPYLPQVFKLDFLPPFYFTYWIVILAIIAITHEVAHGIFMRRYDINIKSTGFGFFPFFLPVFLAAFVEQDEKDMKTKSKFEQMAVLAAGTFANVLTAIFFFGIMWLFFSFAFTPVGTVFDSYAYSVVGVAGISMVNGIALANPSYEGILNTMNESGLNKIEAEEGSYVMTKSFLEQQENVEDYVLLYDDAPAINSELMGVITEINGVKTGSKEILGEELSKYAPGEEVKITTIIDEEVKEYNIVLGEHPEEAGRSWLGVGFSNQERSGVLGNVINWLSSFKKPNVYYEPKFEASKFIYDLLWWIALISLSVALVNMLPVGIFDGGRFFYLTVLAITKSKKIARRTFSFVTYLFLFLLLVMMVSWALSFLG
jgi:membrane-associated protease RseP (regulator of RpoE activity)